MDVFLFFTLDFLFEVLFLVNFCKDVILKKKIVIYNREIFKIVNILMHPKHYTSNG